MSLTLEIHPPSAHADHPPFRWTLAQPTLAGLVHSAPAPLIKILSPAALSPETGGLALLLEPDLTAARAGAAAARQLGQTLLLVTTRPALAAAVCERALLIDDQGQCADLPAATLRAALGGTPYRIRVGGRLSNDWEDWFGGVVSSITEQETRLEGHFPDQSALYGLLERIRALNLPLLSVERLEPELRHLRHLWPVRP